MPTIITLLSCFDQTLDKTTLRQLQRIVVALLTMTGRVTMRGIARWSETGGSYRTVQRFFNQTVPWGTLLWLVVRQHLLREGNTYIVAGDETVVTKAGKSTHGLDRFFSSLLGRPVPGLAFFALSLVSVEERRAYPLLVEQRIRTDEDEATAEATPPATATPTTRQPGRPKGSKNRDKRQILWTPELRLIHTMLQTLVTRLVSLPICYLVLDGHFGHNNALQMVQQGTPWQLISKLRRDAALYFCYEGPQKKKGARKKYGARLDYAAIPDRYLVARTQDGPLATWLYQATMRHKSFADPLNVVIVVKHHTQTGARSHVVLFSSDLSLEATTLVDYYTLRFQIEFNFRDAKQFWGLEDFMNVKPTPITNAVNLAFLMVNLSAILLPHLRREVPQAGVHDLKAYFLGCHYARATLNCLPELPTPFIIDRIMRRVAALGRIHLSSSTSQAA